MLSCISFLRLALILSILLGLLTAAEKAAPALPSIEECEEFGEWLMERFEEKEYDKIMRSFDALAFSRFSTAGLDVDEKDVEEAATTLRNSFRRTLEFDFSKFEEVSFLRVQQKNGQRRVLLRFKGDGSSVNYTAFVCARSPSGVKWIDTFNYATGETSSEYSRRIILPVFAEKKKSFLEKLTSSESALVKNLPHLLRSLDLIRTRKYAEALALLRTMPDELRKQKFALILELRAAQPLGPKEYLEALANIEKAFPNDPTLNLMLFDGHVLRKDYAGAFARLSALEKEVGSDAHLHFLRARLYSIQEDWPAAKRAAHKAIAEEVDFFDAYDTLISIGITTENHREVVDVFTLLESRFSEIDMLETIKDDDVYNNLRKSPEYAAWIRQRGKRAATKFLPPVPQK